MSVLLETSLGDLVFDLDTENCPKACTNFLKLAKAHYYTYNVFFSLQKDFLAQTGDPTESGSGGESVWARLPASSPAASTSRYFVPERKPALKHKAKGTVSLACTALSKEEDADKVAGSQFFITLGSDLDYLDGQHAPFGQVVEGHEPGGTLDKINNAFTDESGRPLQDIRIRHIEILDDPFPDPEGLVIPSRPPSPIIGKGSRLADDEEIQDERTEEEKEKAKRDADTKAAALTLEMVGDLPFAEVRPPENILFVCKLNPVTRSEDLEIFFGRFGKILSCEVIKDKKTGDSLQYAFIEFDKREEAEMAYFKMQNVLIDDRRIWVDFSQSVSNLHKNWLEKRMAGMRKPGGQRGESSRRVTSPRSSHHRRSPSPRRRQDETRDDRRYRDSYGRDHRRDSSASHSRPHQEDRARQGDRTHPRREDRLFDLGRRDYRNDRDQDSSRIRRW